MGRKRWRFFLLMAVALAVAVSIWGLAAIRSSWQAGCVGCASEAGSGRPGAGAGGAGGAGNAGAPSIGTVPQTDSAIVLGAMAWGTEPSPALAERLDPAAQLYQAGRVRHIILTGGVDTGGVISEAEAGARYLQRRYGIPRSAIALDETSTSTATNLLNARHIMEKQGWRTATVVTHGYHLHRAMLLARDVGLIGPGVGVESKVLILPPLVAREVVALGAYWAWEHWIWRGFAPLAVGAADAALVALGLLLLLWVTPPIGPPWGASSTVSTDRRGAGGRAVGRRIVGRRPPPNQRRSH